METFTQAFYFWFSLIYLIIRTLAVSLYSADINEESKRPIEVLRAIPRESWCLEVRFMACDYSANIVICLNYTYFIFAAQALHRRSSVWCCQFDRQKVFLFNSKARFISNWYDHYLWARIDTVSTEWWYIVDSLQ